jgi:membrane protein required for beta-lactamase induction
MEVSQPKLELTQAKDSLIKARVTIHSLNEAKVETDIKPGLETAAKDDDAGKKALAERNHRRVGLGLSLVAIALVLIGLRLYIKRIKS